MTNSYWHAIIQRFIWSWNYNFEQRTISTVTVVQSTSGKPSTVPKAWPMLTQWAQLKIIVTCVNSVNHFCRYILRKKKNKKYVSKIKSTTFVIFLYYFSKCKWVHFQLNIIPEAVIALRANARFNMERLCKIQQRWSLFLQFMFLTFIFRFCVCRIRNTLAFFMQTIKVFNT